MINSINKQCAENAIGGGNLTLLSLCYAAQLNYAA